jgi:hypothetical protein
MDAELRQLEAALRRSGAGKWDRYRAIFAEHELSKCDKRRLKHVLEWLPNRANMQHRASTGDKKVVEMTDSHLANTLAMFWRFFKHHGRWRYNAVVFGVTKKWGVMRITGAVQHTPA